MSYSKNRHQAQRWLQTAEEDVHAAQVLRAGGMYAQTCFYAQQSAEKAVKALWYLLDADPWGHSVQRLIAEFPQRTAILDLDVWLDQGALLDKFYIPTRYPHGLPDLTPGQVYRLEGGRQAWTGSCWHARHSVQEMAGRTLSSHPPQGPCQRIRADAVKSTEMGELPLPLALTRLCPCP